MLITILTIEKENQFGALFTSSHNNDLFCINFDLSNEIGIVAFANYAISKHIHFLYLFHDLCMKHTEMKMYFNRLTLKHRETHGCVISTVATDALVLKHQAISIHNAD